jgi:hypothetical protein
MNNLDGQSDAMHNHVRIRRLRHQRIFCRERWFALTTMLGLVIVVGALKYSGVIVGIAVQA